MKQPLNILGRKINLDPLSGEQRQQGQIILLPPILKTTKSSKSRILLTFPWQFVTDTSSQIYLSRQIGWLSVVLHNALGLFSGYTQKRKARLSANVLYTSLSRTLAIPLLHQVLVGVQLGHSIRTHTQTHTHTTLFSPGISKTQPQHHGQLPPQPHSFWQ